MRIERVRACSCMRIYIWHLHAECDPHDDSSHRSWLKLSRDVPCPLLTSGQVLPQLISVGQIHTCFHSCELVEAGCQKPAGTSSGFANK